ncbi:MAG: PP2C family protein-serine/threonine phosphatase [Bacillota bacterium]|nr:PP2C family protein-serine/threonine phosphatase [Bacillota bacterium]
MNKESKLRSFFNTKHFSDDVFVDNEIKMNYSGCMYSFLLAFVILVLAIFYDWSYYNFALGIGIGFICIFILSLFSIVICHLLKGRKWWIKYLLVMLFTLTAIFTSFFSESGFVMIFMAIPVALSCRYYSVRFTSIVGLSTWLSVSVLTLLASYYGFSDIADLNFIQIKEGISVKVAGSAYSAFSLILDQILDKEVYTQRILTLQIIPCSIIYLIFISICIVITRRCRDIVKLQTEVTEKNLRMKTELNAASSIQMNMLSQNYPKTDLYEIYASMDAAKEVGGDFYDFLKVDDNHIGFLVGDVSDKGVPAALFMAKCETLLHTYAKMKCSVDNVFNKVNRFLAKDNKDGMFVTCFMAVVDLRNGEMEYVDAGHCAPIIKSKNGEAKYLKMEPDLFLGSIKDIKYQKSSIKLEPGDSVLLYTDGVTEAMNSSEELFGKERLLKFVESKMNMPPTENLDLLLKELKDYIGDADQSDDITFLMFEYKEEKHV